MVLIPYYCLIGCVLSDVPLKLLAEGRVANVPVIFGTNRDEGTSFTSCPVKLSPLEYGIFNDLTCGFLCVISTLSYARVFAESCFVVVMFIVSDMVQSWEI